MKERRAGTESSSPAGCAGFQTERIPLASMCLRNPPAFIWERACRGPHACSRALTHSHSPCSPNQTIESCHFQLCSSKSTRGNLIAKIIKVIVIRLQVITERNPPALKEGEVVKHLDAFAVTLYNDLWLYWMKWGGRAINRILNLWDSNVFFN